MAQRGQELEGHLATVRGRNEARRALAAEVIAGRMNLREAAGHFRDLDERDAVYPPDSPRPATDPRALREDVLDSVWEVFAHQRRYAAAARWFAGAFGAEPSLLPGLLTRCRYHAACAAARAGCGQGREATDLDDTSRAGFRRQALDWLRAELEARRRRLEKGLPKASPSVALDLPDWMGVPDFAGVRGLEALARLPEAERRAWQKLWADVADTLARAEGLTPPEQRAGSKILVPER